MEDLIAHEVDGVSACSILTCPTQVSVHFWAVLSKGLPALIQRRVPASMRRHFLLDDVGLDGHPQVIGLPCKICGGVIVLVELESWATVRLNIQPHTL